ncbi:hypothetical protein [Burkholderia sp. Tr-20355]|uniref:hypothetical protein n=1 Tax=Burkholderia sp. Tr-20355 TaxID=2703895 RepID=UPI00198016A4|nr:hypothetical protein [Burkholderia sp. Tr-20355]MBN3738092.1 hypothetical protein [Burkholderia sp. Tr-20355]
MESITLTLPTAYLAVINKGLLQVPYGEAAPVVNHINAEIQAQFDKKRDAEVEAAAAEANATADGASQAPARSRRARRSTKHG